MLIGISGKIGSGKDTVGTIIQGLTVKPDADFEWISKFHTNSDWQIQKFAAKLKDIVCLLIGCTREQLEDQTFKNTPLSEDWIRYAYATGFNKDNNGNTTMISTDCDKERYEIELKTNWQTAYKVHYTPRLLLQRMGTEAGREMIHPNIWVNALFADYISQSRQLVLIDLGDPEFETKELARQNESKWLITDMRFPNEKNAVEARAGMTLRVDRDTEYRYPELWKAYQEGNEESWDDFLSNKGLLENVYHASEMALDDPAIKWDYQITNNGSLEELVEKVRKVLIHAQIIPAS